MKRNCKILVKLMLGGALAQASVASAVLPAGWQHDQTFAVTTTGLVKLSLPVETLDAARPALEDLRLYDGAGNEMPFLIQRPVPQRKVVQNAKSFQVSLNQASTVITIETGLTQPLDGVTLETPALNFIKAVRVEGSTDGSNWQQLAQGQPIFHQPSGASQSHVTIPAGTWPWLRLTVDDGRSPAVPFTGARVYAAVATATPKETQTVAITERNENPGETRLTLNLGAANLDVASVQLETSEPLFTRSVTLAVPQIAEDTIREQVIGQGVIYRVAIEGQPVSVDLSLPLETRVPARELVLLIRNEDSPPLPISAVRIERRPVYLVFLARQTGTLHLLTGNKSCPAPRYDLSALDASLKDAAVQPLEITSLAQNPDYRAAEALAGLEVAGAILDVSAWKFRKPIQLARDGAQQVELDLDVLEHADSDFADVRVLSGSNQVPYIVQRTSISRTLVTSVTATNDAKNPKLSRWLIKLPKSNLPLTRLVCSAKTPLFQRSMSLSEQLYDERGDIYRRPLASAVWTQTPERKSTEFSLTLDRPPRSDNLILETENGDNLPIELDKVTVIYPATRLLFKAKAGNRLLLYYANPRVPPPSYDLNLVSRELLSADKAPASLGTEEQLLKASWAEKGTPGTGGVIFWGVLALVVIGLLLIISRLLPKSGLEN
jgi:hypothetical protein